MGKSEPRFDIDLQFGEQGEQLIGDYLDALSRGNGRIEVKRKRYLDLHFFVETHCDKGRTGIFQPSGISVTTADTWAFVVHDTGIAVLIPTDKLRAMLTDRYTRDCYEDDGDCPTRGKLVSLHHLLFYERERVRHAIPYNERNAP